MHKEDNFDPNHSTRRGKNGDESVEYDYDEELIY